MKHVVFLSLNDFKEKSIKVIKKTPEAYVKEGYKVTYIVGRDRSKKGNYYYEDEINPLGINIERFTIPLGSISDKMNNKIAKALITKIRNLMATFMLFKKFFSLPDKEQIDIIYGYEVHGVLAMKMIKFLSNNKYKYISRFQGTSLVKYWNGHKLSFKSYFSFEQIIALKQIVDLVIMTDDGTQGNQILKYLNPEQTNVNFWVNGVEPQIQFAEPKTKGNIQVVSVSRLVNWKRIDRSLKIISELKKLGYSNLIFNIIGDGPEKNNLMNLSRKLDIEENVIFKGAKGQREVMEELNNSKYFLSMYEMSNVGNPLLESIRYNKIIFTLNNGDTSNWIKHKINGFIYDESNLDYKQIAEDLIEIENNTELKNSVLKGIYQTEGLLNTWEERFKKEIDQVNNLLENKAAL